MQDLGTATLGLSIHERSLKSCRCAMQEGPRPDSVSIGSPHPWLGRLMP